MALVKVEEVVLQRTEPKHCPLLNDNWREDEQGEWNYNYDSDVLVRMMTSDYQHNHNMYCRPISVSSPRSPADWTWRSVWSRGWCPAPCSAS